jgi:8-oxo-dGTP pyrophosphatase MutT (NUDIX family)
MKGRPTFVLNGEQVVSAGIIPLVFRNKDCFFLLQYRDQAEDKGAGYMYEDFGGKSQAGDDSIRAVATREAVEELNGVVTKEVLDGLRFYPWQFRDGKYVAYFVVFPLSWYLATKDTSVFGDRETHDNTRRRCAWLSYQELLTVKLHPRLKGLDAQLPLSLAEIMFTLATD